MDLATLTPSPARTRPQGIAMPRRAFFHCCQAPSDGAVGHDAAGKSELAKRLAALLGYPFEAAADPADGPVYAVPSDTLTSAEALRLGVRGPDDVFGGVVPHAFVATKAITHPLVTPRAVAPLGWSAAFAREVSKVVLPGYTAFTAADAMEAGERLLRQHGCVRLKETNGVGGMGQCVVPDGAELSRRINAIDPQVLATEGLVLEHNLAKLVTYSVGQVRLGRHLASYHGTQHLTRDMHGHEVYGGSSLVVVRGGFDELLAMTTHEPVRQAVRRAMAYHRAARRCFRGFFASRANYDVVAGIDAAGQPQAGVLEQSWRIGGASGAEVAALQAFQADGTVQAVKASTHEVHGEAAATPPDALVYFDGVDARIGRLRKYAVVRPHDDNA
jgi:Protein of unknown function (DUF3182)